MNRSNSSTLRTSSAPRAADAHPARQLSQHAYDVPVFDERSGNERTVRVLATDARAAQHQLASAGLITGDARRIDNGSASAASSDARSSSPPTAPQAADTSSAAQEHLEPQRAPAAPNGVAPARNTADNASFAQIATALVCIAIPMLVLFVFPSWMAMGDRRSAWSSVAAAVGGVMVWSVVAMIFFVDRPGIQVR